MILGCVGIVKSFTSVILFNFYDEVGISILMFILKKKIIRFKKVSNLFVVRLSI